MSCSEKTDLQQQCNAAWIAYADYAGLLKGLALGTTLKKLTPPSSDFMKAWLDYHESVRALDEHLIRHRC